MSIRSCKTSTTNRGIASSPATGMAEEAEKFVQEALRNPSDEWFISILDSQQPDPEARPKHRIPKAPAKFREYEKDKKYFDPRVVSLGPYHHGKDLLKPMEKYKIRAVKQFFDRFTNVTGGRGGIYKKFKELTGKLKECYDADMSDDVFARMMFLDGCFVLHFIEKINLVGGETMLEISNDLIPLIIRDMFLIENQLPFEVLDVLMNLLRGSISLGKQNILEFIERKVLMPMGFYPLNSSRSLKWCREVDGGENDSPLHLLDILRNILLNFPPSKVIRKQKDRSPNCGSVMELKQTGIRFEKRCMKSLMDISYKENLFIPQLLLPTMFINDTTISQLLNLTALEACSDTYSGCGVSSYIHFIGSLINDDADVKELQSNCILHHSLGSDEEVALLFNKWPAEAMNDLQLYSNIRRQIRWHRDRKVKIYIAIWWDHYFGTPWSTMSIVGAGLLLVLTGIQTYFAAFPRR